MEEKDRTSQRPCLDARSINAEDPRGTSPQRSLPQLREPLVDTWLRTQNQPSRSTQSANTSPALKSELPSVTRSAWRPMLPSLPSLPLAPEGVHGTQRPAWLEKGRDDSRLPPAYQQQTTPSIEAPTRTSLPQSMYHESQHARGQIGDVNHSSNERIPFIATQAMKGQLYPNAPDANGPPTDGRQRKRRGNLPKETTDKLREWFISHLQHPYPTEDEKQELMGKTGLQMSE